MENFSFIIFNGLGKPRHTIKQALQELTTCEINQVADFDNKRMILTYVAILVLGLLIVFLCLYLMIKNKEINSIWESLRKRVHLTYFDFKGAVLDRLNNYQTKPT